MAKLFILLSHERSGSHLVGEYVASLDDFKVFDEVCNPNAVEPEHYLESFYRFKHDTIVKDQNFLLNPTPSRHVEFVKAYFNQLLTLRAPHRVAVDIKYGHVQNFEHWWWPILERPALLSICEGAEIGIIHLYRENVIEATVSTMIADRRKVWHSWQVGSDSSKIRPFHLPVEEIVRRARLLEQQTHWFREWTKRNSRIEITYERAAADLGKNGPLESTLTTFLGATPKHAFAPRVQKLTPPLREIVENFGELKQACEKAGWERFVP